MKDNTPGSIIRHRDSIIVPNDVEITVNGEALHDPTKVKRKSPVVGLYQCSNVDSPSKRESK